MQRLQVSLALLRRCCPPSHHPFPVALEGLRHRLRGLLGNPPGVLHSCQILAFTQLTDQFMNALLPLCHLPRADLPRLQLRSQTFHHFFLKRFMLLLRLQSHQPLIGQRHPKSCKNSQAPWAGRSGELSRNSANSSV